ncbi:major facilitator superfamily domain-containing protein [Thelonectria olida]|uniref:Major facilitator superfamily domain-containing protein n=1 Tax=Thelonectria olida TaxID=1576542 RepID=A0A9P8WE35_9HYPO|nr:major facilitator superfamily domain-containing protein [Thelonectria olida]
MVRIPGFRRTRDHAATEAPVDNLANDEKTDPMTDAAAVNSGSDHDLPTEDAQRGVQDVEAVTLTWSKKSLVLVFALMFLLYFVNAFQSTILGNLAPFVTSEWESHSLLNVIYIVSSAMTAAMFIPLAKILDLWGRAEGFACMTLFATLGLIMMATCRSLAVFCAAQVFYSMGFMGVTYCIDVITADVSKLKNRGLAYAFTSSPYMITAFAGSKASEDFYVKISWRWGFGIFAIILPVVAAPLFILLKVKLRQAKKQGLLVREKSGRTAIESIHFYMVEFDAAGVFLFASGLTIFLLPFTLAATAPNGWKTGYIIAMIVLGFVLLGAFGFWEVHGASRPFLRYDMLVNRTVLGACLLAATYQISYYCWATYFTSFLQVVMDVGVAEAGYINNTFNVVSGFLLFIVGYSIHKTGYFKWLLYIAVPLYIFSQGLMIHFRRPNQSVGYLIMCEVFISIGGSIFIIVQQLAVLAAVDHQHVAAALALVYVVGTTGGAIGYTISGSIWSNTFRKALLMYLPSADLASVDDIVGSLEVQLSYAVGTDSRRAIQRAYAYGQTRMLAAGTGIMVLAIIWVLLIKNINVAKIQQTRGVVF